MTSKEERQVTIPSQEYGKILVAHDGSKNSERALARAAAIARDSGASLIVITVVNYTVPAWAPMAPPIPESVIEDLKNSGKNTLDRAIEAVRPIVPNVTGMLEDGNPADRILSVAEHDRVDLIVLGRRGISGIERFLLGGVSSRVVDQSKCDVMVVR